jgi:hypothetical protein
LTEELSVNEKYNALARMSTSIVDILNGLKDQSESVKVEDGTSPEYLALVDSMVDGLLNAQELLFMATDRLDEFDVALSAEYIMLLSSFLDNLAKGVLACRTDAQINEANEQLYRIQMKYMVKDIEKQLAEDTSVIVAKGKDSVNGRPLCEECNRIHPVFTLDGVVVDEQEFWNTDLPQQLLGTIAGLLLKAFDVNVTTADETILNDMRESGELVDGQEAKAFIVNMTPIEGVK